MTLTSTRPGASMTTRAAVSYTHLDVYKRQAQEILLEYLEEIERIERHEEDPFREMEGSDGARQPGAAGHSGAAGQSWVAGHSGVAEQTGVVSGDVSVPEELLEKSGWYAGWDMFQADVKDDGTLTLASVGTHEGSVQTYRYHDDGRFYGEFGAYINACLLYTSRCV